MATDEGYRKVGHKARHGRRGPGKAHGGHRTKGGIGDPISRAMKRMKAQWRRRDDERVEKAAW